MLFVMEERGYSGTIQYQDFPLWHYTIPRLSHHNLITLRKLVVFRGHGIQNGPIGFRKLAPSNDSHLPFSPPLLLYPWRSKSIHQNLLRPPHGRHIKRGDH